MKSRQNRMIIRGRAPEVLQISPSLFWDFGGSKTGLLVVLVHGVNADCESSWRRCIDEWVGEDPIGFDLVSFHYAAMLWHNASLMDAVNDLGEELRNDPRYARYRHIIFVGHSTGGLVIKRLLLNEEEKVLSIDADYLSSQLLLPRTRRIVNIGVPHEGSTDLLAILARGVYPIYSLLFRLPLWLNGVGVIAGSALALGTIFGSLPLWLGVIALCLSAVMLPVCVFGFAVRRRYEKRMRFHFGDKVGGDQWFKSGVCSIWKQLALERDQLIDWEVQWQNLCKTLDSRGLNRPGSIDYLGKHDFPVKPGDRFSGYGVELLGKDPLEKPHFAFFTDATSSLRVRGSHSGIKLNGLITKHLQERLESWGRQTESDRFAMLIADWTGILTRSADNQVGVTSLISSPLNLASSMEEVEYRTYPNSRLGSQGQTRDDVLLAINKKVERTLITGDSGVGKTAVLRSVSSTLAASYLRIGRQGVLPLFFPLYRIESSELSKMFTTSKDGSLLDWRMLAEWWVRWLSGLINSESRRARSSNEMTEGQLESVSVENLLNVVLTHRIVFVLDGIDELNAKCSGTAEAMRSAAGSLIRGTWIPNQNHAGNNVLDLRIQVVFGVRSSFQTHGFGLGGFEFEISRLSPSQVQEFIKDTAATSAEDITKILLPFQGSKQWKLISTPLILGHLARENPATLKGVDLGTRAGVLHRALRASLERYQEFVDVGWERCLEALTLIAHAYHAFDLQSESHTNIVQYCTAILQEDWGSEPTPNGYALVSKVETCQRLLERTIFMRAGDRFRVGHREWGEFLESYYLHHVFAYRRPPALGRRPCKTGMFFLTGDLLDRLSDRDISTHFLDGIDAYSRSRREAVLTALGADACKPAAENPSALRAAEIAAQIPIGNLLGVVGHCRCGFEPGGLERIVNRYVRRDAIPLVQLVAIQTLGFRCLREDADNATDAWREPLRARFTAQLREHYSGSNGSPMIEGVANLLLRALGANDGWATPDPIIRRSTQDEYAGPRVRSEFLDDALTFVASRNAGRRIQPLDPLQHAMQQVFLNLLNETRVYPSKGLACATYTGSLIAAYMHGAAITEVREYLPEFLFGRHEAAIRRGFDSIPVISDDLHTIWDGYRQVIPTTPPRRTEFSGPPPAPTDSPPAGDETTESE